MFRRRIFYNPETGVVLHSYVADGYLNPNCTAENEAAALGLTGCACFEWTTPDADIEAAFEPVDAEGNPRIVNVSVDVSGEAPQLVFSYEAVLEQTQDNPYDIIDTLTGEV